MALEKWFYTIPLRLRSLFRRRAADQDLDDELHDHVAQKNAAYRQRHDAPRSSSPSSYRSPRPRTYETGM